MFYVHWQNLFVEVTQMFVDNESLCTRHKLNHHDTIYDDLFEFDNVNLTCVN